MIKLNAKDFFLNSLVPFPIYFFVAGQYVLFKHANAILRTEDFTRLKNNNISCLYIPREHEIQLGKYMDYNISAILANPNVPLKDRSTYLINNAKYVVQRIFEDPENPQGFIKSQALVKNFVNFISQGIAAFHALINLSIHDLYTYTHSIGVMTYSIALASQLGIKAPQTLNDIGLAGLFHDIGKAKIPQNIINKPGPLNEDEWNVMRRHALFSFEIATAYNKLPELPLIAIKQHHENLLGSGYPDGISGSELFLFSKLISICDIYSAITTDRPYSKAKTSFDSLSLMKNNVQKGLIDKILFQHLVLMLKS